MSGVNRNILQNGGIPLAGRGQTNIDLVTTSGSRWVIMNFPPTFLSSSNGGTCNGITLQWTPDSSLGFETSSVYYAVTESVLNCEPYSLSPLTSSIGYEEFINMSYAFSPTTYYMRAYQNFVGGGKGPYSDIVTIPVKSPVGPGAELYSFDTECYDPISNKWYAYGTSGSLGLVGAWTGSTTPEVIKWGGPNYDAIRTYGSTLRIPMDTYTISGASGWRGSVGLVSGSVTLRSQAGKITLNVAAVSSTTAGGSGNTIETFGEESQPGYLGSGLNTHNRVIGFYGGGGAERNGNMTFEGTASGDPYVTTRSGTDVYGSGYIELITSADCIIRAFTWGGAYSPSNFHIKYGPGA